MEGEEREGEERKEPIYFTTQNQENERTPYRVEENT